MNMIFKKLQQLFTREFNIIPEYLTEDSLLEGDLGIDMVDLALALEDFFELEPLDDLSHLETVDNLIDFLQGHLDL